MALILGMGIAVLQVIAVGALNQTQILEQSAAVSKEAPQPLIVVKPPEDMKVQTPISTSIRTQLPKPMAATSRLQPSALQALSFSKTKLSLGSLLPNLGEVELGGVDVSEVPTESDQSARVRRSVEPIYPISAQRNGIEGYVLLRLNIDENGRVKDVFVVDSDPIGIFERSARDAARRFEFSPKRVGGVPVPTTLEKKILFSLQ